MVLAVWIGVTLLQSLSPQLLKVPRMNDGFKSVGALLIVAASLGLSDIPDLRPTNTLLQAADEKQVDAIELFNGRDVSGWREKTGEWMAASEVPLDPKDAKRFAIKEGRGVLVNGPTGKTVNLVTTGEFGDLEMHVEFVVPQGSNSGVYFMGRYEIQVLDSFGHTPLKYGDNGGIYRNGKGWEGKPPNVNVSKAPGEWQTFEIIFRAPRFDAQGKKTEDARFVKVVHNGKVIHENVSVNGPTTAAAFTDEKATGPIMLQGDHGPVAYRHLRVRKVSLK